MRENLGLAFPDICYNLFCVYMINQQEERPEYELYACKVSKTVWRQSQKNHDRAASCAGKYRSYYGYSLYGSSGSFRLDGYSNQ